jgi:iron(III) transport system permease protein
VRYRWGLDYLASLPLVFPGLVAGIAVLRTYIAVPLPIYSTLGILVLGYIMLRLPFGMRYAHAGMLQIQRELEECAEVSGARWSTVLWRVVLPLMLPALFASWIYVFLISMQELSLAILLYSPTSEVLGVRIFQMWENGQTTELSAFSMVVIGVVVTISLGLYRVSRAYGLKL